jgi:glycosyltransferase involved in cell wall biosynthesis
LELDAIKGSFGYKFMRFYASRIDRLLPDHTRRGEFRKIAVESFKIASTHGMRKLLGLALEKIKRREFHVIPTVPRASIIESPPKMIHDVKLDRSMIETISAHKVLLHCDNPILSSTTPTKVSNFFLVSGWALSDLPIREVKIYLDDSLIGLADYGTPRTDVGEAYPNFPNANRSGFRRFVSVDCRGLHRLKIVVQGENLPPTSVEGLLEIGETDYFRPVGQISQDVELKPLGASVSVVILTKSPPDDFEQTLERLRGQRGVAGLEILVVNSGDCDLGSFAKKYGVKVYDILPGEFEHAATRNFAAEKATGDYIVFMVDDAVLATEHLLHDMTKILESSSTVGAATARQIPRSDADMMYCQAIWGHYRMLGLDRDRIVGSSRLEDLTPQRKRAVCQIDDVCSCFRTDVFLKYKFVKGLGYAEDLELGVRMVKDGLEIAQLFSAGVVHSHNRPPSYYLRRSYVDYKVLSRLLDYPVPEFKSWPVESWNGLIDLILRLVRSLDFTVDALVACRLCDCSISRAFERIRNGIREDLGLRGDAKTHNEDLLQILQRIKAISGYRPGSGALSGRSLLAERYLISLGTLEEWLSKSHQDLSGVEAQFFDTLYKMCAVEIGHALGEFMAYGTDAGSHEERASELDRFLSEGV